MDTYIKNEIYTTRTSKENNRVLITKNHLKFQVGGVITPITKGMTKNTVTEGEPGDMKESTEHLTSIYSEENN